MMVLEKNVEYKFRMPRAFNEQKLHTYAEGYNKRPSDLLRMSLRKWNREGRVAVDDFMLPATRGGSVPYTLVVPAYLVRCGEKDGKPQYIPGKTMVAVVNWYLSKYPEVPVGPPPFEPPPNVRYIVEDPDEGE